MEVVLVGQEKQAAVVKKRIEDSPNPPMLIHISRLGDWDEVDSDILALGLHQQHIGIEFLHRVGFAPKDFGVPPIVEIKDLFGGGGGQSRHSDGMLHCIVKHRLQCLLLCHDPRVLFLSSKRVRWVAEQRRNLLHYLQLILEIM